MYHRSKYVINIMKVCTWLGSEVVGVLETKRRDPDSIHGCPQEHFKPNNNVF